MFITFEGPEGSGKTTQSALLFKFFQQCGLPAIFVHEPGGTGVSEKIREVLLAHTGEPFFPVTELLLFNAARTQIVGNVIAPALAAGKIVVCDRFADSTRAYQAYASGNLDRGVVEMIINLATGGLEPDLTFLIDLPVEVGLERRKKDSGLNRIDARESDFHQRVRAGYLEIAATQTERFVIFDGLVTVAELEKSIRRVVCRRLQNPGKEGWKCWEDPS